MPYKTEQRGHYLPAHLDRRRKYTDDDYARVRTLNQAGYSQRYIARTTGISRRMIGFILVPEKRVEMVAKRDWRQFYDKEKNTQAIREHRRYKHKVLGGEKDPR